MSSGGAVPWLTAQASALHAAQLAESCYLSGKTDDEAPLMQLLHHCSAALSADISAAPVPVMPAAAHAGAGADAGTAAAPTTTGVSPCTDAGGRQPSAALAQARTAEQPGADQLHHAPEQHNGATLLGWDSKWACPVVTALKVPLDCWLHPYGNSANGLDMCVCRSY